MKKLFSKSILFAAVIGANMAQAVDLKTLYSVAQENDANFKAALAGSNAQKQLLKISRSGVLPSISASASQTTTTNDGLFNGTQLDGVDTTETAYGLSARWQVLNAGKWFDYAAGSSNFESAGASEGIAKQQLILRVAQAYFDILRATDNLASAKAEEAAVKRQLEQTQQRFNVGLIAVTEVHEAKAVYDGARVGLIVAEGNLRIAYEALEQLTGRRYDRVSPLKTDAPLVAPSPAAVEEWESLALANSLFVKQAEHQADAAGYSYRSAQSAHGPSVDITATYGQSETDNNLTDGETTRVNVELSMPLFAGGAVWGGNRKAFYEREQAQANLDNQRRSTVQKIRSLHLQVNTDVLRIQARKQAMISARSALEATQTGYEVGTRNVVEVLQAQQNLYRSERDHANARYDYILNLLNLKFEAGTLKPSDVDTLNGWLVAAK